VLELSKNNTSKHNVLYSKEKVDELIDKVLHAKTVLKSTSSLVTTEIAPNSEETPVVQILNPNNSDNDVQLVEPVKDTATSEITTDITETPIQHARKRAYQDSKFRPRN
jgi:3-hydroxyacyl-CoA dehydrogenase